MRPNQPPDPSSQVPSGSMRARTIQLSDDLADALDRLAERNGVSVSSLLREGAMLRLAGIPEGSVADRLAAVEARLDVLESQQRSS